MFLKNSLVETFSNNFPKLINNSSSLNSVNHKCDGVCISDINWYRCCNFNFPFLLVSVSVEKIGVLVCIVCQTPKTTLLSDIPKAVSRLDDILVAGIDEEDHLRTLSLVLKQLLTAGFRRNKAKCKFLQKCVTYLSHEIDGEGLHPTEDKLAAIRDAPRPKDKP